MVTASCHQASHSLPVEGGQLVEQLESKLIGASTRPLLQSVVLINASTIEHGRSSLRLEIEVHVLSEKNIDALMLQAPAHCFAPW